MQKPSVGRIVHYQPGDHELAAMSEGGNPIESGTWLAAVVVRVWSDTCVNLRVFTDGPSTPWVTSATLGDGEYNWRWPPRA